MNNPQNPSLPPTQLDRTGWHDSGWILLLGLVLYGTSMDYVLRGDAAVYANYVLLNKFDELTLHLGYYLLIAGVNQLIGEPLGIPLHYLMVHVNVFFGAVALVAAYRLSLVLIDSRAVALGAVAIMAMSERVILNATGSEIYMVQVALMLLAFDSFARNRVLLAGVLGGLALYVTPLCIFGYLFFPALDYTRHRRIRWDVLLKLALVGLMTYTPFLIYAVEEMLWGQRGVLTVSRSIQADFSAGAMMIGYYLVKHYTFLLVLLPVGFAQWKRYPELTAVTLAVFVPHLYVAAHLGGENGVFLTVMDAFIGAWMAIGAAVLWQRAGFKLIGPAAYAGHLIILLTSQTIVSLDPSPDYGEQMRAFVEEHVAGQDAVVLSDWDLTMTLTYFGRPAVTTTIWREPLYAQMRRDEHRHKVLEDFSQGRQVWLVDPWDNGRLAKLLLSGSQLEERRKRHSVRANNEIRLDIRCEPRGHMPHPYYLCAPRADGP